MKNALTIMVMLLMSAVCLFAQNDPRAHILPEDCPNGALYLPAPPTLDDSRFINDWNQYRWGIKERNNKERLDLALLDGNRDCALLMRRFAPALGFTITPENAPKTFKLMNTLRYDASAACEKAKVSFARKRPYQQFSEPTPCPEWENDRPNSYPSGHTAQGWLYAMVFTYLDPENQNEILKIGYDYGVSRIILGYHYQSDTDAGRLAASATFARLLAVPGFFEELQEAKAEYQALKEKMMHRTIVVLYDNDVHCGIDGYPKMAGLRDAILATDTAYVAVVSSGDFIQGGTAGTLSKGQYIVDIMNFVGYDAITIGNHEFDYKVPQLFNLTNQLNAPVTCVNFSDIETHNQFYAPYVIKQFGARKVAFVGVLTPSTLQSEGAAFYDDNGKQLYDLHHDEVYRLVQNAADSARAHGADYVVVLSHLGEANSDIVSGKMIASTTGIDAVLDGHTHSVIPGVKVTNKKNKNVLSSQTGTKFANIGKLVIKPNGRMTTELLPTEKMEFINKEVAAVVDSIKEINALLTGKVCGHADQLMTINDENGKRLVRSGETNLANFVADAYRWYGEAQLAFSNGGGIRQNLPQGDITYGNLMDTQPFGNELCVIKISGKLLCDVIEVGAENYPGESGFFVQPSGFKYTIHKDALPRVSDVQVLNENGEYEPIDMDKVYTLATLNYNLSQYKGLMLNCELTRQNIGLDVEAIYNYLIGPLKGRIGSEYAHPQGRITIR
jgi:2',3'-cyclic-nucleotide 2'-phosphodiesterase (5'-nucleotidase family)